MSATYKCDVCGKKLSGKIRHYNPYETSEFVGDVLVKFAVNFNQWTEMGVCELCDRKKIKEAALEWVLDECDTVDGYEVSLCAVQNELNE